MGKRTRMIQVKLYLSEDEKNFIERKMAQADVTNFSMYARKMLIDGYIIHKDYPVLKELSKQIGPLNRNINQITKRVNETRSIYEQDIIDLKKGYAEVRRTVTAYMERECHKEK